MNVKHIYTLMDKFAPFDTAEGYDNCGLIVGDFEQEVGRIGLALDITHDIIDEALRQDIRLIITHHPPIFHPLKQIHAGSIPYRLVEEKISVLSAHTNLDRAEGGTNTVLGKVYGLHHLFSPETLEDFGRVGTLLEPTPLYEYANKVKNNLHAQSVRCLDAGLPAYRIAYISGSGGSMLNEVIKLGIDTFITGDIKHDVFVDAQNAGINLIEAGHFDAENRVFSTLGKRMNEWTGLSCIHLSPKNPVRTI